jgi:archaellin
MSTNNTAKTETNNSTNTTDTEVKKDDNISVEVISNFGADSILNFSIPQWDYVDYANELNSFRKGLTGIASDPGWFYFKIFFHFDESFGLLGNVLVDNPGNTAYNYLMSRKTLFKYDNLSSRALALEKFVKYLSFINCNAPWFFDKIDGLDKAIVSLNDFSKEKQITISCLEDAVDMRLTSLFHLYQYACYDEINMKEIIPENLRKFNMTVVLYHVPIKYHSTKLPNFDAKSIHGNGTSFSNRMSYKMFTFKGCEFNLESLGSIIPSSADNAQAFNLAKSSITINYDRVFTHLMNEWNQFMVGPDGIYFDKEHKIDDYDPSFTGRILELLKANDSENYGIVDMLLSKPVTTFVGKDVSLGNIYNINPAKFKGNIMINNATTNNFIGNIYGLEINKIKARVIEQNNPRYNFIDVGNIFGINAKKFITYMVNMPGSRNFSGGKLAFSVEAFDKVTTRNGNRIDFYKQGSKSRKNFSHNINELYAKLDNNIFNINKQYNGSIENVTSSLPKNANNMYVSNIDSSNITDYMLSIQSIDTQKSIWDNLAMSWESMKSSVTYALKNAFKF